MSPSTPYISIPWVLMIPPGRSLTAFEKLFRPFDITVWIPIVVVFVIACITIRIIKASSKNIRNLVFGPQNQSPYLNLLIIFVEGSMHLLPKKWFARSLLMMFILYSLVLRTLYQGELVKYMQSDDRKLAVSSVAEMMEKNFSFFMEPSEIEHTQYLPIQNRYTLFKFIKYNFYKIYFFLRSIAVTTSDLSKYILKLHDSNFQGALAISLDYVIDSNKKFYGNGHFEVCKEYLLTYHYGIYFRLNSFLVLQVNDLINSLNSNGMIFYWEHKSMDMKYLKASPKANEPRILDLHQLAGGFIILLLGLSVSSLLFVMEIIKMKHQLFMNIAKSILRKGTNVILRLHQYFIKIFPQ